MTYTAETIRKLAANGELAQYIAMTKDVIDRTAAGIAEKATVEPDGAGRMVTLGHLHGSVYIDVDNSAAPHFVCAHIAGSDWEKKWAVSGFADQHAAIAYATKALSGALRNKLTTVNQNAVRDLAALEAAR